MKNILTKKCELSGSNAVTYIIDGLPKSLHGFISEMDDSGSGPQSVTAYICNKTGHMARMCRDVPNRNTPHSPQSVAAKQAYSFQLRGSWRGMVLASQNTGRGISGAYRQPNER
ncbi:hypothetical protein GWI33_018053 [Rhynchophorus ferrugineus]|uniref:CCHC-type domain-containing protein n=1 Tax=Rhynchophorus ferrugineus TaxID=354439 RepID=A0A834M1W1_RHYFE|nr:hypothetical protein GWI33_018053 [Rhynchophorus ferrugineus]